MIDEHVSPIIDWWLAALKSYCLKMVMWAQSLDFYLDAGRASDGIRDAARRRFDESQ